MKRILSTLLLLLAVCSGLAQSQNEITAVVVITNIPPGLSSNIVINAGTATTRYFTNATAGVEATHIMATNSIGWTKTNLLVHLVNYPAFTLGVGSPQLSPSYNATNSSAINLTAPRGTNITVTFGGLWAFVYYVTNPFSPAQAILSVTNTMSIPARTNAENAIVNLLARGGSSNAIPVGTKALSNYLDRATSQTASNKTFTHTVIQGGAHTAITNLWGSNVMVTNVTIHIVTITGGTYSGFISSLTNGTLYSNVMAFVRSTNGNYNGSVHMLTNGLYVSAILLNPVSTNGLNYGNAFSSPGAISTSEQFGAGAVAYGNYALAIGNSAQATNYGVAVGQGALAQEFQTTVIGTGASANKTNAIAIGTSAAVSGKDGIALGTAAAVAHDNSIAIGGGAQSTTTNQIVLGSSVHTVTGGGIMSGFTTTNFIHKGTNVIDGRIDFKSRANTGLANGNNAGVILGSNVYVRLSGATTIAAIAGFAAEQDGSFHVVQLTGAITNTFLNESGVDATAANRIVTGTGADLSLTNTPLCVNMIYDATASRWRIVSFLR